MSEKHRVLMENMLGEPDGPASLGEDGKLADAQIPGLDKIGAAPDGFGLGGIAKRLTPEDDLNAIYKNGWYYWTVLNNELYTPQNAPLIFGTKDAVTGLYERSPSCALMQVSSMNLNASVIYIRQIIRVNQAGNFNDHFNLSRTVRMQNGQYLDETPWEFESMPFWFGYEFRTAKRRNKKPVYTMLLDAGNGPDGTTAKQLTIPHGIANVELMDVVSSYMFNSSGMSASGTVTNPERDIVRCVAADRNNVYIMANDNRSTYTFYAVLEYTKTTDP